jgi:hypothetical protein
MSGIVTDLGTSISGVMVNGVNGNRERREEIVKFKF